MDQTHEQLVTALREVLTDDSMEGSLLIRRIPVLCNDVKWIKRAVMGIYALIGVVVVALLLAHAGATISL